MSQKVDIIYFFRLLYFIMLLINAEKDQKCHQICFRRYVDFSTKDTNAKTRKIVTFTMRHYTTCAAYSDYFSDFILKTN